MEMEGMGFSDLLRNSTKEILIKSMMDSPIGIPAPSMEIKLPFRADSEDLFNSWLNNGEIPNSGFTLQTWQSSMGRKFADIQGSHTTPVPRAYYDDTVRFKHQLTNKSNFCNIPIVEMPNRQRTFLSSSNLSTADTVSSIASISKGTLDCKKYDDKVDGETFKAFTYDMLSSQEATLSISSNEGAGNLSTIFNMLSPVQVPTLVNLGTIDKSLEMNMKCMTTEENNLKIGVISQEPSLSESSTAAAALSSGLEVFDCSASAQSGSYANFSNTGKHVGKGFLELESKKNEFSERIFEDFNQTKKESLMRVDSISSGTSVDNADPKKKRRVERSRKMAEAKEKNSAPVMLLDMQTVLKRCENLEKEVRSLKLNLSFMNRKDSDQSKQIEDLQKQNEELREEKECISEELERIVFVCKGLNHNSIYRNKMNN